MTQTWRNLIFRRVIRLVIFGKWATLILNNYEFDATIRKEMPGKQSGVISTVILGHTSDLIVSLFLSLSLPIIGV